MGNYPDLVGPALDFTENFSGLVTRTVSFVFVFVDDPHPPPFNPRPYKTRIFRLLSKYGTGKK